MSLCWSVPFLFLIRPISSTPPSLSVSPSPKSFMSLSTSSFLSSSPHFSLYHCLSIFVSLHLWCLSFSPSLPARVGPGGSGTAQPGRRCEQCGIQEAGRRHGNAPAPPSPRAGRACQEGAMVTSGACPPRAPPRPRTLFQDWARRGRPVVASAWSQEGLPSSKSLDPQCPRLPTYKSSSSGWGRGERSGRRKGSGGEGGKKRGKDCRVLGDSSIFVLLYLMVGELCKFVPICANAWMVVCFTRSCSRGHLVEGEHISTSPLISTDL